MQLKNLNEIKVASYIPKPFLTMYDNSSLSEASSYLSHEKEVVYSILSQEKSIENVVVIGSGPAAYLDLVLQMERIYVGIDPFFQTTQQNRVYHIGCDFEALERSNLPPGPCLYLFWFNVLHYLNDPGIKLNKLVKPNDIVIHSTWSNTEFALINMKAYFKSVYQDSDYCYQQAIRNIRDKNVALSHTALLESSKKQILFDNNINSCSVIYV